MALVKLGDYIELSEEKNTSNFFTVSDVRGLSIEKKFIDTKADMDGVNLKSYLIVAPEDFAYVTVTSRNGEKITLAYNSTDKTYIVSSSYVVFHVKNTEVLIPEYLFMIFNRPEFDRYARFNSWGSARETFSWDDMCNITLELPSIDIQLKYANIYKAMVANLKAYENGLEDLKLTCDGYIENLKKSAPIHKLGEYIKLSEERNADNKYSLESVRGIATSKRFITTKADMDGVSLHSYKVVNPRCFAYVADTSRRGDKISLALNMSDETYLVSSISTVFSTDFTRLVPEYLELFFERAEFDRYARFNSWGSARETFDWSEMCNVEIPVPDLSIQKSIADIFSVYNQRKKIAEKMRENIKSICPVLIQGVIREAMQK